jgi:glycogen phosphorylase/synthase
LKSNNSNIKTVFTTHATTLGRTLGSQGITLSKIESNFDPYTYAKKCNILDKHTTEIACAKNATFFTTVSGITAEEARLLLGKSPDVLTYNGLDSQDFPDQFELKSVNESSRKMLIRFVEQYFDPHYTINPSNVVLLYTSGRPEFINKGFSLLLNCFSKLKTDKTVVCFFFVPWKHGALKTELQKKLFSPPHHIDGLPDVCTHYIENESDNFFIKTCKEKSLLNEKESSVKVIWYPVYLGSPDDTIFKKSYYEIISGCDLGIFPSLYEPWGYTPLESISAGVPAITSTNCGFGEYMGKFGSTIEDGLGILNKSFSEDDQEKSLVNMLQSFCDLDDSLKFRAKIHALMLAKKCGWRDFIDFYLDVYT